VIAPHSAQQSDSVTAALCIHLIVYCAVGACFAFALYALLQPSRAPNSGLEAYKPPPRTVVTYGRPFLSKRVSEPIAPVALISPEPTTTGDSTSEPQQLKPTVVAPSKAHTAKRPKREVRVESAKRPSAWMESPKRRIAACIPGYDSSGAQTRPCG
jgi:hypothetical protein